MDTLSILYTGVSRWDFKKWSRHVVCRNQVVSHGSGVWWLICAYIFVQIYAHKKIVDVALLVCGTFLIHIDCPWCSFLWVFGSWACESIWILSGVLALVPLHWVDVCRQNLVQRLLHHLYHGDLVVWSGWVHHCHPLLLQFYLDVHPNVFRVLFVSALHIACHRFCRSICRWHLSFCRSHSTLFCGISP